jgi:hypothetical protein
VSQRFQNLKVQEKGYMDHMEYKRAKEANFSTLASVQDIGFDSLWCQFKWANLTSSKKHFI